MELNESDRKGFDKYIEMKIIFLEEFVFFRGSYK